MIFISISGAAPRYLITPAEGLAKKLA